jgi:iron complex outermembrane receptor protein
VGANYYKHRFDTSQTFRQLVWPDEPGVSFEDAYKAPGWALTLDGEIENYGLFTEETFELRDDFRITAGLRYDKTKLIQSEWFYFNINSTPPPFMNALNPPDFSPPRGYAEMLNDKHDYDNVTYKLRFEYDVTPDNMLYFLTATGFMPGYTAISPTGNPADPWAFLMLDQQKLTNYEIGTKNYFLGNTLRVNATAFYYDYEGYPEAINVRLGGGPPTFTVIAVPLEVIGLEVEIEYLITMNDKISFFGGYLNNEIAEFPESVTYVPFGPPGVPPPPALTVPGTDTLVLKKMPGHPEFKATLAYDHTFLFGNGSTLVPRAELVYTGDYYLQQMNFQMIALGQKPYNYRDSLTLFNVGATWTSASQMYSVTGYMRNAFDEEYKANVKLDTMGVDTVLVTPGDPRTFGVMISAKF